MPREILLRAKDRIPHPTCPRASLDLALELFIAAKKGQRLSPCTVQNYRYVLDKFIHWLKDRGIQEVATITPHDIRLFIVGLMDQGMTAWSVHDHARAPSRPGCGFYKKTV